MRRLRRPTQLTKRAKMLVAGAGVSIILLGALVVAILTSAGSGVVVPCKEGYVRSSFTQKCVRAGDPNFGETRSGEREHTPEESEHTPEENARHRRSLESQKQAQEEVERSLEKDKPQIEQAHREADKACYETGRTEAECNSPEHQRQEERANAENRQRQIESGELQVHE